MSLSLSPPPIILDLRVKPFERLIKRFPQSISFGCDLPAEPCFSENNRHLMLDVWTFVRVPGEQTLAKYDFLDGERIRKAHSVRHIEPIFQRLATSLAQIPELRYIKIFPERLTASNVLSQDGKKNPVVEVGAEGIVGVELLIDRSEKVVQFYALTSVIKGCGRKMVEAVIKATPEEWQLAVVMDWSGGFWPKMAQEYPRLVVF